MKKNESAPVHWSKQKERAIGYWQVKFILIVFKVFPIVILRIIAFPIGFFYFLFSEKDRKTSSDFLKKAAPFVTQPQTVKKCRSVFGPLRHICSFSLYLVEKIQSWGGKFPFKDIHFQNDDINELIADLEDGRGAFLISSHLGNSELLRGLVSLGWTGVSRKVPVTAIVDFNVNMHFIRVLNELNPQSGLNIINTSDISPSTSIILEERLNAGELVVIAGDRTSAGNTDKHLMIPFLGEEAPFSFGAFYMAVLMKAPVYFMFVMRAKDLSLKAEYNMHIYKFQPGPDRTRKDRERQTGLMARSFTAYLERHCKEQPFQWYNFFDFWTKGA